ncbi:Uncharacterised protein [Vibrio cholerae]|nr:Uncharacterised protein [Vibrio cholerae]CSB80080.1 Uncharacterised protein [Vibrio cholerae]CSD06404.1 Uncharacterised protein [Vibrio cholerae]
MPFLSNIPERLKKPSKAINPNGVFSANKPVVTPITAKGTVSQTISDSFTELNKNTVIRNMNK